MLQFQTAGQTKQAVWRCHFEFGEIIMHIFHLFVAFYKLND